MILAKKKRRLVFNSERHCHVTCFTAAKNEYCRFTCFTATKYWVTAHKLEGKKQKYISWSMQRTESNIAGAEFFFPLKKRRASSDQCRKQNRILRVLEGCGYRKQYFWRLVRRAWCKRLKTPQKITNTPPHPVTHPPSHTHTRIHTLPHTNTHTHQAHTYFWRLVLRARCQSLKI